MTQLELLGFARSEPAANEVADAPETKKEAPELRLDGGTQPRERLDEATVARYAEEMTQGLWDFSRSSDRSVAFDDGTDLWLADGFHRQKAASLADRLDGFRKSLEIRQGTVRDAVLYSAGANARHGVPRSIEDKRRIVTRLLKDSEWKKWSDREIARRCHVHHSFVSKVRDGLTGYVASERAYTTKHGTPSVMQTGAIGRTPKRSAKPAAGTDPSKLPSEEIDCDPAATARAASEGLAERAREAEEAASEGQAVANEAHTEPTTEPAKDPDSKSTSSVPLAERPSENARGPQGASAASTARLGRATYLSLARHLQGKERRPRMPARKDIEAMNHKNRETVRRMAEQARDWAVGLLDLLDTVDGNNA